MGFVPPKKFLLGAGLGRSWGRPTSSYLKKHLFFVLFGSPQLAVGRRLKVGSYWGKLVLMILPK